MEEVEVLNGKRDGHSGQIMRYRSILSSPFEETPKSGYGRCRSCDCRGYISKHNGTHECKNCQHHYDRHYD